MQKFNEQRKSCKDVFNSFLVKFASYSGIYEFPRIKPTYDIPDKIIVFSKAVSCKEYNQWVHFYEDDYQFERLWRNPKRYLPILKKFKGVILPDFSLYRDMPFVMQLWNIYRSRAIGHWLQIHGVKVIPNIRYGDRRTFKISCDGIQKNCVISVGAHGTMKKKIDKYIFLKGLDVIVKILNPCAIIIYGNVQDKYLQKYIDAGIKIVKFASDYSTSHKEVA